MTPDEIKTIPLPELIESALQYMLETRRLVTRSTIGYPADLEACLRHHMSRPEQPLPMILHCPVCGAKHVDAPDPSTGWTNPPHRSHLCAECGVIWRPADVPTCGVENIGTRGSGDTWPHKDGPNATH